MTETQTTAPAQDPSDPAAQARRDLSTSIGELVDLLGHVDGPTSPTGPIFVRMVASFRFT